MIRQIVQSDSRDQEEEAPTHEKLTVGSLSLDTRATRVQGSRNGVENVTRRD